MIQFRSSVTKYIDALSDALQHIRIDLRRGHLLLFAQMEQFFTKRREQHGVSAVLRAAGAAAFIHGAEKHLILDRSGFRKRDPVLLSYERPGGRKEKQIHPLQYFCPDQLTKAYVIADRLLDGDLLRRTFL